MSAGHRQRIAVLLGDPAGVGPEMGVKLLARAANAEAADILLVAPASVLAEGERVAGVHLPVHRVRSAAELRGDPGIAHLVQPDPGEAPVGQCSEAAGAAALQALAVATDLARQGQVDGIVFAPLNKHSLRLAGMTEEDELRFMQRRFGVEGFVCEFNITGELWTSRVTSHVPVREVADLITQQSVGDAVRIIDAALRQAGIARPRIAVSGLNPHAGDSGSIGREEIDVIAPAVQRLREAGLDATGPWSPDTVFIAARRGDFDAVVSMYHDQGQIAMKLMGFDRGVTLLGGFPFPICTPAHGTAYDIAGKGVAGVGAARAAILLAAEMAQKQKLI